MSNGNNDKNQADKQEEDMVTVSACIPRDIAELINCIVTADNHSSKSNLIRRAVEYYVENVIDPDVRRIASEILEKRHQSLEMIASKKSDADNNQS